MAHRGSSDLSGGMRLNSTFDFNRFHLLTIDFDAPCEAMAYRLPTHPIERVIKRRLQSFFRVTKKLQDDIVDTVWREGRK